MINLFKSPVIKQDGERDPLWKNIEAQIELDFIKYKRWFSGSVRYVGGDNIFVRFISTMDIDINLEYFKYIETVKDRWVELESNFPFTTSTRLGDEIEHTGLGDNKIKVTAFIDDFPVKRWNKLTPIRIMSTTSNDVRFKDLTIDHISDDLIYVELDILALMTMYRGYALERIERKTSFSIGNMIYAFAIPNAMSSLLNLTIVNLHFDLGYDELDDNYITNNFMLKDRRKTINKFVSKKVKIIEKDTTFYQELLSTIQCYKEDGLSTTLTKAPIHGYYYYRFFAESKFKLLIKIILMMDNQNGDKRNSNSDILSDILYRTNILKNDRVFIKSLSKDLRDSFDFLFNGGKRL